MTAQIGPAWEWTDDFGDKLEVYDAGENLVLSIVNRGAPADADHAAVSLSPEQLRGLRAALGVHVRDLT